jgi:hypothetical protein
MRTGHRYPYRAPATGIRKLGSAADLSLGRMIYMDLPDELHHYGVRALRHVAALSSGAPVHPSLRVTLNFHPDRVDGGRHLLRELADGGTYLSQFVTGTGNGGLTAYPGGDRWVWEQRMFGGCYDEAPASARPVYGALNFRLRPVGGAPRFGSAHLRLTADAVARATFCYPDSYLQPSAFAVASRMSLIELALADEQDGQGGQGGQDERGGQDEQDERGGQDEQDERGGQDEQADRTRLDKRDMLDDYVEAHVHGPVRLDRDVEALVLDPSYRGTEVDTEAKRLACPVEWHPGFRLSVAEMRRHPGYRGPEFVELGAAIAVDGYLTPRIIGDAVRTGRYDPQALKRVWHYVARFGGPS